MRVFSPFQTENRSNTQYGFLSTGVIQFESFSMEVQRVMLSVYHFRGVSVVLVILYPFSIPGDKIYRDRECRFNVRLFADKLCDYNSLN